MSYIIYNVYYITYHISYLLYHMLYIVLFATLHHKKLGISLLKEMKGRLTVSKMLEKYVYINFNNYANIVTDMNKKINDLTESNLDGAAACSMEKCPS